jgi:hypothetical protein
MNVVYRYLCENNGPNIYNILYSIYGRYRYEPFKLMNVVYRYLCENNGPNIYNISYSIYTSYGISILVPVCRYIRYL